jgi:general secretion pathway protein C
MEAMGGIEDVASEDGDTGQGDEKLLTQRAKILKELNLEPVNEHAAEGYRVLETPPEDKNPYGLQKGDIILSANGYPLGAKAEDVLAKQVAESLGKAQVLVVRGGTRVEIDIQR